VFSLALMSRECFQAAGAARRNLRPESIPGS